MAQAGAEGNHAGTADKGTVSRLSRKSRFRRNLRGKVNQNYLAWLAKHPEYFPGAEEFLKKLAGAGRIYIVTNGTYAIQTSRFKISKLDQYADGVFVSEKIGCDKPGEAYTEYVTSHIPAFNRSAAVWIGDSLTADIRAANDAGIDSIWFNPHNRETEGKGLSRLRGGFL